MVFFNAILNGLFSAVVGGILAGVGIQWLTYIIKERGPDVALGEAFAIYLGVIAGVVFGFIVGVICSPLMPFATYLKGIGVVVSGLVVLCAQAFFATPQHAPKIAWPEKTRPAHRALNPWQPHRWPPS